MSNPESRWAVQGSADHDVTMRAIKRHQSAKLFAGISVEPLTAATMKVLYERMEQAEDQPFGNEGMAFSLTDELTGLQSATYEPFMENGEPIGVLARYVFDDGKVLVLYEPFILFTDDGPLTQTVDEVVAVVEVVGSILDENK